MQTGAANQDGLGHLDLLASAIAQRDLHVVRGEPGAPAWTDGRRVFVDPDAGPRAQLEALAVQASLLAAGSLDRDVLRRLARRPALARRYLAFEGHRALAASDDFLPRTLQPLIDADVAARSDSPAASLAASLSRAAVADPPESFGVIRARPLLTALRSADAAARAPGGRASVPREEVLAPLEQEEDDEGATAFASPVGGGGTLGRLLGRLLKEVRRLGGGGPPGADAPTRWARSGAPSAGSTVLSDAATGKVEAPADEAGGTTYPEWDVHRRRYRRDWCTVREVEARPEDTQSLGVPGDDGLRRALARLGMGLDTAHRQAQGDDIDLDAAIEARVASLAGCAPDEAVYLDSLRRRRDLSVLLLLDVSGSTAEPAATGQTVHEQQRRVAGALCSALHQIGDRVALYAFHSRGRSAVSLIPVKRFDDAFDPLVLRRLHGLVPGAYSRLGAAIRHASSLLRERGATSRRLLVVLSDGLAYDHGYEPTYGAADARRALSEARSQGLGCLCLSIGASTDAEVLRRVFGSAAHATLPRPHRLGHVIGPLLRSALRSAEVRRRVSP